MHGTKPILHMAVSIPDNIADRQAIKTCHSGRHLHSYESLLQPGTETSDRIMDSLI